MSKVKRRKGQSEWDGADQIGLNGDYGGPNINNSVSPRRSIHRYSAKSAPFPSGDSAELLRKPGANVGFAMWLLTQLLSWTSRLFILYNHYAFLYLRLGLYLAVITLAGLIKDYLFPRISSTKLFEFISSLQSAKKSVLNVYFVKLGWLWTLVALLPFILITRTLFVRRNTCRAACRSEVTTYNTVATPNGSPKQSNPQWTSRVSHWLLSLLAPLARLALATAIWYYSTQLFVHVAQVTSYCQMSNSTEVLNQDKTSCTQQGNQWVFGFDISGHIFIMAYSNLIRIEEFSFLLTKFEEFAEFRYVGRVIRERWQNYVSPYAFHFSPFYTTCLCLTCLTMLVTVVWDYMMLQTSFFYHSLLQKLLGLVWASLSWFVTYKLVFANKYCTILSIN